MDPWGIEVNRDVDGDDEDVWLDPGDEIDDDDDEDEEDDEEDNDV